MAWVAVAMVAAALSPGPARAQVFGQFTGAETLPVGGHLTGAYVLTSDKVLGALGQLRLSLYPGVDFGFQGGLARLNLSGGDRTSVRLGGDFRAAVVRPDGAQSVAVAAGAGLSVETTDDYTVLTVGPTVVASRTFRTGSNSSATPYAGAAVALSRFNLATEDKSDLSLPLRLGGNLEVMPGTHFVMEFQLFVGADFVDDYQIAAGANFTF